MQFVATLSLRGGPHSISGHFVWGLRWTKWHLDRFFSKHSGFPTLVSFYRYDILIYVIRHRRCM